MKTIVKLALAVALGVMGFAAPAAALTIHVTNVSQPYFENVNVAGFGSERSGQIVLTTNIGNLGTWCVDLFHNISLGSADITYTTVPLATDNSGSNQGNSNPLSATQIQQIQSLAAFGNANLPLQGSDSAKNHFSALVQAAIWQVEYLAAVTGAGTFNADLATLMLQVAGLPVAGGVQLESLNDSGLFSVQNLDTQVSEPGTLALVGSILVALGLLRRRLRLPATSPV